VNKLLSWAEDKPLFNLNQAQRQLEIKRNSLKVKLSRLVDKEKLNRIEKGKYTVSNDPIIYASHVETPSYISLWAALNFYNLTTQQPTKTQIICSKNRNDLPNIEFYESKNVFGYTKTKYRGFEIFIAEKEKLFLDILKFGKVPVEELEQLANEIDYEKLVEYAQRIHNNAVSKRAGLLIQKFTGQTLEELKIEDSNYPLLDLTKNEKGDTNSEWRLKVNNNAF
jgi:predicted transcriptional regulator of viral defense system